jgi:putative ABC transport system substrate-binding protein
MSVGQTGSRSYHDNGMGTVAVRRTTTKLMVVVIALLLIGSLVAEAQPPAKVPRVGYLSATSRADVRSQRSLEAFRQGLRDLGYVESQSIMIEYRWADWKYERLPDLAAELVRLPVDVIVTGIVPAILAAKNATSTIPIVMTVVVDPVATGLVASIARPGRNITGSSMMAPELVAKQLELLREVVPQVSRVAILWNPANPGNVPQLRQAEVAARALGLRIQPLEVRDPTAIDRAFMLMTRERAGAFLVLVDSMLIGQRERIADLAAKSRLPAVYGWGEHAEAGGLMAYSANRFDSYRRAAVYVAKILKGAKPGDLPIEQATQFELIINLKTAKALGLTIPSSLMVRADQVIE